MFDEKSYWVSLDAVNDILIWNEDIKTIIAEINKLPRKEIKDE